jgi:23S rRNA pseudouridine2604 synthase
MSFRKRIKFFLVHTLKYTNKGADKIIASGTISINGKNIVRNELLKDEDEIKMDGRMIRETIVYSYYALNKPVGIESSFKKNIKDNLSTVFPFDDRFFIAGRLDKASEGLLLISNNGKWVRQIAMADVYKEKEYEVEVDKEIGTIFIEKMGGALDIGIGKTRPCIVKKMTGTKFSIVLTEGKNRQIRRMCKKLGFTVIALKRIRIDEFYLFDLEIGKHKLLKIQNHLL